MGKLLQGLFGVVLFVVILRGIPPSQAQHTLEDANTAIAVQAHDLSRAHDDIEEVKAKNQKLAEVVNANTTSLSNIDAEVRTIGGVLFLIQIGIGVWQKNRATT